jgi:hypothetical protein
MIKNDGYKSLLSYCFDIEKEFVFEDELLNIFGISTRVFILLMFLLLLHLKIGDQVNHQY